MKVKKKWGLLLAALGCLLTLSIATKANAAVPDISEWQGKLTSTQVKNLKSQANFVINRVQYGTSYEDIDHTSNESLYVKYGVPFGSYDYATFTTTKGATAEAKALYERANKNTKFYVLDFETTSMSSSTANAAVKAWYKEMRKLTNKKLIFYSYQSFATTYANTARQSFDAQWIANYSYKPTITYSLWQYTDSYYLSSLGQYVDNSLYASASVSKYHPLSWWLGTSSTTYAYSSYSAGQHAYLHKAATKYYDGTTILSSAKQKIYKITATKSVTTGKSKQLVYLSGLNKWVASQYVDGYWIGQHGSFKLRQKANVYSNVALTKKTGKSYAKGKQLTGKVVKYGNLYRIKVSGGYITAQVRISNHAYYESVPSSKQIKTTKALYKYSSKTFSKSKRASKVAKGTTLTVTSNGKRSSGSRYFKTSDGYYVTALHNYVKTK
ncbi:GH25 family lysozyme [Lactiplantibacillus daowaiensis]|uniref:GH25 family lysozyme n=1 Tax=Lactiplantibacillus daowaiensis TaxID=2559918 RepID=A0ABW1S117_9LACO|nr:GH25 family lysozyme [Lactiplantibacillus daowaiensis]